MNQHNLQRSKVHTLHSTATHIASQNGHTLRPIPFLTFYKDLVQSWSDCDSRLLDGFGEAVALEQQLTDHLNHRSHVGTGQHRAHPTYLEKCSIGGPLIMYL